MKGGYTSVTAVKLLRTDTTLDLSQKARVVRILSSNKLAFIRNREMRTDQFNHVTVAEEKINVSSATLTFET